MVFFMFQPGSLFYALRSDDVYVPCLITSVNGNAVYACVVTIQLELTFDAETGMGNCAGGDYPCSAMLVCDLPEDIRDALLDIDRKYRVGNAPEGTRLLKNEIEALNYKPHHGRA